MCDAPPCPELIRLRKAEQAAVDDARDANIALDEAEKQCDAARAEAQRYREAIDIFDEEEIEDVDHDTACHREGWNCALRTIRVRAGLDAKPARDAALPAGPAGVGSATGANAIRAAQQPPKPLVVWVCRKCGRTQVPGGAETVCLNPPLEPRGANQMCGGDFVRCVEERPRHSDPELNLADAVRWCEEHKAHVQWFGRDWRACTWDAAGKYIFAEAPTIQAAIAALRAKVKAEKP